ncbi:MAG: sodium:glucose symporter, partial [Cyclobacteriaceae bacterium]|nr:sodium:glucose symporter [Cyclobacteriaceae bacterium]
SKSLAWYAVLLGYPIMGIWYWCTDQTIVQRVLGAETEYDAQTGPLFAALLKFLPVFIIIFPGVIAYVIFSDKIGEQANQALPVLITELIPTGLKGLISAGILAALMSTIAAALHSSATLVSLDLFKNLREKYGEKRQILVGRISAVVVMLLAMLWSTQGYRFSSIFEANAIIVGSISPAITTVFVWGVFWRRGTGQAAVATFITGILMGALAVMSDIPVWGDKRFITDVLGIGPLLLAWWGFVICSSVYVIVSLLTPKPDPEIVNQLTWGKPWEVLSGKIKGWKDPRVLSVGLMIIFVLLYTLFR